MVLSTLTTSICAFLSPLLLFFRSRVFMQLEILALRHQLTVYQRLGTKPRLKPAWAVQLGCPKSVGCTSATNEELPEHPADSLSSARGRNNI